MCVCSERSCTLCGFRNRPEFKKNGGKRTDGCTTMSGCITLWMTSGSTEEFFWKKRNKNIQLDFSKMNECCQIQTSPGESCLNRWRSLDYFASHMKVSLTQTCSPLWNLADLGSRRNGDNNRRCEQIVGKAINHSHCKDGLPLATSIVGQEVRVININERIPRLFIRAYFIHLGHTSATFWYFMCLLVV